MKPKYYTSIDEMPIYNWFKLNETNDLSYVLVDRSKKFKQDEAEKSLAALQKEYIDVFGINESFKQVLETKAYISSLIIDKEVSGDQFIQNFINIAIQDLEAIAKESEKVDVKEIKVHTEKYLGFRLNDKEITVREYYTYVDVMNKDK